MRSNEMKIGFIVRNMYIMTLYTEHWLLKSVYPLSTSSHGLAFFPTFPSPLLFSTFQLNHTPFTSTPRGSQTVSNLIFLETTPDTSIPKQDEEDQSSRNQTTKPLPYSYY